MSAEEVIWHDLECGSYRSDLPYWRRLARGADGPVLDVGAGTGRVALELAHAGERVIAVELDPALAAELRRRADGLAIDVRQADACDFAIDAPVSLCVVPMQTIHLLADRVAFLRCARAALAPGGLLAVALLGEGVEPFELELAPDAVSLGGVRYESVPTALRRLPPAAGERTGTLLIERRRTRLHDSPPRSELHRVILRECDAATLVREARPFGFELARVDRIAATREHAGSEIACLEVVA
jgi:SAM-dependent methyltransferase